MESNRFRKQFTDIGDAFVSPGACNRRQSPTYDAHGWIPPQGPSLRPPLILFRPFLHRCLLSRLLTQQPVFTSDQLRQPALVVQRFRRIFAIEMRCLARTPGHGYGD